MKKKTKIIIVVVVIGIVGLLSIGGFIIFRVFVTPPTSEEVCEKVREIMTEKYKEEIGEGVEAEMIVLEILGPLDHCIKEEDKSRENKGLLDIKKEGDCIMKAKNYDDLDKCEVK